MRRIVSFIIGIAISLVCFADSLLSGTPISAYGWKGLDLGSPHVITIVGWQPQSSSDVLLGVFEGANSADFMDALPLMIIADQSFEGQMNFTRIDCSKGFRYVRFVAPSGKQNNLPKIEFYGDAGEGDYSRLSQITNLPTVTIHTKNNQDPTDKVNEIDCFISIISNDGQKLLADTATVRLRGNASLGFPKKPYRIKFAPKHQVLNAPANAKKWTLINNYGDKTLMRNQLAFELSRRLGMPYTPFCAYVDVLFNGDYKGCYQLCDQVEVRSKRVEVTEITNTDNSGEALTGGYFIEIDGYASSEISKFRSNRGTDVTIKSPDEEIITPQQTAYIKEQYDKMENNWRSNLDLNTFLRHFLVGELSGNTDTYWSTYIYKRRGNDTLFVGPVWDFDIAFDNDYRTYPVNNKSDYVYRSGGSTVGYTKTLVDKIVIQDAEAKQQLAALWANTRKAGLTEASFVQYIDEQAALLDQSQRLNFTRWPILSSYVHMNPQARGSYSAEVDKLRRFMRDRIKWMDNKLGFDDSALQINETVKSEEPKIVKFMENGQIFIKRGNFIYSITGQKLKNQQ